MGQSRAKRVLASAPIVCLEGKWTPITESLQRHWSRLCEVRTVFRVTHNSAAALVAQQLTARVQRRDLAWQEWKRAQCAAGEAGGALFQFSKRTETDPEVVVPCNGVRSASPQVILENDNTMWNGLWQKLSHLASTPCRDSEAVHRQGAALPMLRHDVLRMAARSFKVKTAESMPSSLRSSLGSLTSCWTGWGSCTMYVRRWGVGPVRLRCP